MQTKRLYPNEPRPGAPNPFARTYACTIRDDRPKRERALVDKAPREDAHKKAPAPSWGQGGRHMGALSEDYASKGWMVTPLTTRFTVPEGDGVSGVLPTRTELSRDTTWPTITNGRAR